MIQKNGSPRRSAIRPISSSNILPQTPSIRTVSSFGNLRRKVSTTPLTTPRSLSTSRSASRSSSPMRIPFAFDSVRSIQHINSVKQTYQGSISVAIRVKPSDTSGRDPWFINGDSSLIHNELGEFHFDHVFAPDINNHQVYEMTTRHMVEKLFDGFNATVFAYGMTGSGKTYTMSGQDGNPGLILLCVEHIFDKILSESILDKKFEVKISYLEIYNERIYDLLNSNDDRSNNISSNWNKSTGIELKIRDDREYGVKVIGLKEHVVTSSEDAMILIATGHTNRKTGGTDFNARSSRSHAIVLIRLICQDLNTGLEVISTLSLCDLAGSERATGQQERRKEGAFINKSLLALGTVISKLSAESAGNSNCNSGHIPYRDSKLTRILQPALSGDSVVTTICTIDTRFDSNAETINTVRFASRAKNITMNVKKNEVNTNNERDHIIEYLRKQLEEHQETILMLRKNQGLSISCNSSNIPSLIESENRILKMRLEHCEKLLNKDSELLSDPQILEIIEMLPDDIGTILEAKFQGLESQLREYKIYTSQLVQKIKTFTEESMKGGIMHIQDISIDTDDLIHEQEAELIELKKSLKRKDKMIEALQSARRLRDTVLIPKRASLLNQNQATLFQMKNMIHNVTIP